MAATTRTPWRPMPSPRSREVARTEAPPTQRALDPLQAAPAQLGHAAPDEEPGQDVEAGVDPHGRADADRVDHRQQRQRDEQVGAPERGGLQARAGAVHRQRVDLRAGQPARIPTPMATWKVRTSRPRRWAGASSATYIGTV